MHPPLTVRFRELLLEADFVLSSCSGRIAREEILLPCTGRQLSERSFLGHGAEKRTHLRIYKVIIHRSEIFVKRFCEILEKICLTPLK